MSRGEPVTDARSRPPDRRVLHATVTALKTRRGLPIRDPRRVSASWLRPNWPFAFVMNAHRDRVVQLLVDDADLRAEVRTLLGAGLLDDVPLANPSVADLESQLADSVNPEVVLEAAATHPDTDIAGAAVPYLIGELSVPVPTFSPVAAEPTRTAPTSNDAAQLRRQLRDAKSREHSLQEQVRLMGVEVDRLQAALAAEQGAVSVHKAKLAELNRILPTARQRRALEAAAEIDAELRRTKRALDKARVARGQELQDLRKRLAETERDLSRTKRELETERTARRRLEQGLGDAHDRARRLASLVEREAADLTSQASSERLGPDRSRLQKRATALGDLLSSLSELYELDIATASKTPLVTESSTTPVVSTDRNLRVTALGGSNHIGGSAILVEAAGTRILVDAGLRPQAHISRPGPKRIDEAIRTKLDAIIITHAHADHAGYVPWVVEQQRQTKVFCTPQTKSLLPTVWADSVRVMRAEADAPTIAGQAVEPPYGEAEVSQAEDALRALPYGMPTRINDVEVTLFDAGHIFGAAGVVIRAGGRRVVITGDIDDRQQQTVGPAQVPSKLANNADLLVIETTYCDRVHRDREQEGTNLVDEANSILAAGGRILIPAFGLGRAQEIALLVGQQLPDVEVRVDGLAATISELYAHNNAPEVLRGRIRKVTSNQRAREIRGFHNGIIITTSGMLTGGAAVPWAQAVLTEPESALFLCGHQDEESPGKELERLADLDPKSPRDVNLRDSNGRHVTIPVAAKIVRYNLSAHADRTGLKSIIEEVDPKAIMLVHGEPRPQETFRAQLEGAGYRVVDNQEPWDSEAPVADARRPRQRHAAKSSRRGTTRG